MGKLQRIPAQTQVQSQVWQGFVVILEESAEVKGPVVTLRVTAGRLQVINGPGEEMVEGVGCQRSANRKTVKAVELVTRGLPACLQAVLPHHERPGVGVVEAIGNRSPLIVHAGSQGKCTAHVHLINAGHGRGIRPRGADIGKVDEIGRREGRDETAEPEVENVQLPVADLVCMADDSEAVLLDAKSGKSQTRGRAERGVCVSVIPEPAPRDLRLAAEEWTIVRDNVLRILHWGNAAEDTLEVGRVGRSTTWLSDTRDQELPPVVAVFKVQDIQRRRINGRHAEFGAQKRR